MAGLKVLACGGRTYADAGRVAETLYMVAMTYGAIGLLIEGGAPGADRLARLWARREGIHVATIEALWDFFGKSAGPRRNAAMLLVQPDICVAFPGGTGTANMVAQARALGVRVEEVQ